MSDDYTHNEEENTDPVSTTLDPNNDYSDPNVDDFSDLWDDESSTANEGKSEDEDDHDGGEGSDESGEDDDKGTESGNESDGNEDTDTEGDTDEEDDEDNIFELDLNENFDETLVNRVETLLEGEQFYLSMDKVKELFDGTEESYNKLMSANKQAQHTTTVASIYQGLPERGKDFFNYLIETKGEGDLDGWLALEKKQGDLVNVDVANMTDEQARAILKADHKAKGISEKNSNYIIEAHEDEANLISEAKLVHKAKLDAVAADKAQKLEDDKAAALEKEQEAQVRQQSVVKAINATKYSKAKQQEIYNLIYTSNAGSNQPRIVDMIANIIQNKPDHLVRLVSLFDGYTDKDGFDIIQMRKQMETKVTKNTKRTIKRRTKPSTKGRQTSKNNNGRDQSIDDWLSDVDL